MIEAPVKLVDLAAQQARIRPEIDSAISRVLNHGQFVMGPEVTALEHDLSRFCNVSHVISCSSGTDALLIAMMALGIGRGDAVLCPAFTYTATPETVALLGATPIFVDVDDSYNVSLSGLEGGLHAAHLAGLHVAAAVVVDLFGRPADYRNIEHFARQNNLSIICDAAQSFGATFNGREVGTFGRITTTSFFPSKPLGCYGDGGAILTNDRELATLSDSIRQHGKAPGDDKYNIQRVGINGRLDTLQAAVLIQKMTVFNEELLLRSAVANVYKDELSDIVIVPDVPSHIQSAWAQYTVRVNPRHRSNIMRHLIADGIQCAVYYPRPVHMQPAYQNYPISSGGLSISTRLCEEVLSLPMHPYLTKSQQGRVIESLKSAMRRTR